MRIAAGSDDHFSNTLRVSHPVRVDLRKPLVVVNVTVQDYIHVFLIKKAPPRAGGEVVVALTRKPRLMPVGQDASFGRIVQIIGEPQSFRALVSAAAHEAAIRVETDDVSAATVE
jgi:hypothetical protein